jgi:MFS family permease
VYVLLRRLDSYSSAMVSTNITLSDDIHLTIFTDQGVMSGIITEPIFLGTFPKMASDYKLGSIQALVVAIYEIGCLLGSFAIIGFGDKLGRRRAVLVGTLIMLVGTAIQASSTTLAQLIVGRYVFYTPYSRSNC